MKRSSTNTMTHRILPGDVNHLGTLFGGRLLEWMDAAGEVVACQFAQTVVVTVAVEEVAFTQAMVSGDFVRIDAILDRIGNTSLGVTVRAWREPLRAQPALGCVARFTYVALDEGGRPTPVKARCLRESQLLIREGETSDDI